MSKVCPIHNSEMTIVVIGGVTNHSCRECGKFSLESLFSKDTLNEFLSNQERQVQNFRQESQA